MKTHRDDLYLEIPIYRGYPDTTELVMDLKVAVEKLEIKKRQMLENNESLADSWDLPSLDDQLPMELSFLRQLKIFLVELENEMDRLDKQESSAMGLTEDVPF